MVAFEEQEDLAKNSLDDNCYFGLDFKQLGLFSSKELAFFRPNIQVSLFADAAQLPFQMEGIWNPEGAQINSTFTKS